MTFFPVRGRACRLAPALVFGLFASALAGLAQAAGTLEKVVEKGGITLGYRESSLPFSYLDGDKKPVGYSVDLCLKVVDALRRELKRPELAVRYVPVTSATRIPALLAGDIDLECGSTTSSAERRKQVAFTIPTFIAVTRLLVNEASGIRSIYDLAGKTVVTTKGATSEKFFGELNRDRTLRAELILGKEHAESFALLESGKADAFVMDDVLLYSLRAEAREPQKFAVTRDTLTIEPLALMLRKDDPGFKRIVDAEVTRLINSNEINALYKRWFETPIPPKQINLRLPMGYLLRDSFKAPTDWLPN